MHKLLREPLVHFLLIGAGLFVLSGLTQAPGGKVRQRIVVNASQVEQLAAQFARTWLRSPTDAELAGLLKEHVRDEVYYREALAMGLDQNDPVIRRRMRQKLEFILEDLSAEATPDDAVLAAFLQQHADRFQVEPRVSFHQLYLNPAKHPHLESDAKEMMARLRVGISPEMLGDPIMVEYDYTLATRREIARLFGAAFAAQVLALEPDVWAGPLYSSLGGHLVLVTDRREGHLPELQEVRAQVEREYLAQHRQELQERAYQKLLAGYDVVIEALTPDTAGKSMTTMRSDGDK